MMRLNRRKHLQQVKLKPLLPNQNCISQCQNSKTAVEQQIQPHMQTFLNLDKELKALSASHSISLMIKPRILQSGDPLATVVLNSTHYLGGAHGASAQTYYNFDLEQKKLIKLDDIILPKQKAQLEAKAYEAFKIWVMESKLANDVAEYEQAWKFKLTDNFTCLNRDWRCNMPNMRLVLMWWVCHVWSFLMNS